MLLIALDLCSIAVIICHRTPCWKIKIVKKVVEKYLPSPITEIGGQVDKGSKSNHQEMEDLNHARVIFHFLQIFSNFTGLSSLSTKNRKSVPLQYDFFSRKVIIMTSAI